MAAALRRDRQEWVIREESAAIVKIITEAFKPVSLHRAVTEQMALTRNKPLKKDVYRFVRWSVSVLESRMTKPCDCLKHMAGRLAKNVVTGVVVTVGLTPAEDEEHLVVV
ncbi:hypothetical protein DYB26_013597 [Aphanomyces astaci]|uniref:Uncharacterized protein n=1 Tax=Aphanomyces astaci TaxID=112090 RepID=A0A3R7ARQ6_APHAT|nr:hypothetical protein DYB26_013597 [Aphanomyces astaci]